MGGEGSMMHAIKSLKENRALLKRRKLRSKDDIFGVSSTTKLEFKKTRPEDMAKIRLRIEKEKKKIRRINLFAAITTFAIILLVVLYVSNAK